MPTLFIGHGSPMNIVANNNYTKSLKDLGQKITRPKSILVISAHWLTEQPQVLNVDHPKTIHDFGGFPEELYQIAYPAPGAPELANEVVSCSDGQVSLTDRWGLDHGAWAVLLHMFPNHDIPVTQLSIGKKLNSLEHYKLAQKLKALRSNGTLVIGSGNLVHNLREFSFDENAPVESWSQNVDQWMKKNIFERKDENMLNPIPELKELWSRAHPTAEHYMPILYALGASDRSEKVSFVFEEIQNGTISMRSVLFG